MIKKRVFLFLCMFFITLSTFTCELRAKLLKVVVSGYALEKVIKEACPFLRFQSLLPPQGELHSFEPSLSRWRAIKEADLVILVGTEPWAEKVFFLKKNKGVFAGRPIFVGKGYWR